MFFSLQKGARENTLLIVSYYFHSQHHKQQTAGVNTVVLNFFSASLPDSVLGLPGFFFFWGGVLLDVCL